MRVRSAQPPAFAALSAPAVLARLALAYVLVFQGIAGAMANGMFVAIGPAQTVMLCHGAGDGAERFSDKNARESRQSERLPVVIGPENTSGDDPRTLHGAACCFAGCLTGGALLAPPDRNNAFTAPWRSASCARFTTAPARDLPCAPAAAFQPRGPPPAA